MPKYSIQLRRQADKFLQKAPNFISINLREIIDDLAFNPYRGLKMHGKYERFRKIVINNYRIVYLLLEREKVIYIFEIESRGNMSYDR